MTRKRVLLVVALLLLVGAGAGVAVAQPWKDDLPKGAVYVQDLPEADTNVPVEQRAKWFIATDALVEGKPDSTGNPTFLDPKAVAVATKDAGHPIEIIRLPEQWVTAGDEVAYCAVRKEVDQPDGWIKIFAAWRLPRSEEPCS